MDQVHVNNGTRPDYEFKISYDQNSYVYLEVSLFSTEQPTARTHLKVFETPLWVSKLRGKPFEIWVDLSYGSLSYE